MTQVDDSTGLTEDEVRAIAAKRGMTMQRVPQTNGERFVLLDKKVRNPDLANEWQLTIRQVVEALFTHS